MFSVQNDKLVDFDHVPLCYSLKLVEPKKLEYISDILTNFQTSNQFSFRDIPILTRNVTCFQCKMTNQLILTMFHSCYSLKLVEPKKLEYISDILTNFQTSNQFSFRDIPILTRNVACFQCKMTNQLILTMFHCVTV